MDSANIPEKVLKKETLDIHPQANKLYLQWVKEGRSEDEVTPNKTKEIKEIKEVEAIREKTSGKYYLPGFFPLFLAVVIYSVTALQDIFAGFIISAFLMVPAVMLILIDQSSRIYVVTNKRVSVRSGIISRNISEVEINV